MMKWSKNSKQDSGDNTLTLSDHMRAAQKGDQKAYQLVLEAAVPLLTTYFKKRIFDGDVDDIIQETLMAVHTSRHTYVPDLPFENWLYGLARFKMLDALRKSYKKSDREVQIPDSLETFFGDETNNDNEARLDVEKILNTLPKKQRDIVYRSKIMGEKLADIAVTYKTTESNIKVIIHRAFHDLKEQHSAQ